MTESPWIAALLTLFVWWFSTGVILWRVRVADNGRSNRSRMIAVFVAVGLLHISMVVTLVTLAPLAIWMYRPRAEKEAA